MGYVIIPEPKFPNPPPGAAQSLEKADTESSLRRAYFTDFTREQLLTYYQGEFANSGWGISYPSYKLNYPPEDAQTLIRDQTRSTFLEEIVHPLRESLFVNGFEPKVAKDEVWYKGIHYRQKIIIKYVPSNIVVRVLASGIISILACVLILEWSKTFAKK